MSICRSAGDRSGDVEEGMAESALRVSVRRSNSGIDSEIMPLAHERNECLHERTGKS